MLNRNCTKHEFWRLYSHKTNTLRFRIPNIRIESDIEYSTISPNIFKIIKYLQMPSRLLIRCFAPCTLSVKHYLHKCWDPSLREGTCMHITPSRGLAALWLQVLSHWPSPEDTCVVHSVGANDPSVPGSVATCVGVTVRAAAYCRLMPVSLLQVSFGSSLFHLLHP